MNNKIKFILPRLLGLTVLVGLATFILSMVFKLLLAGLALAVIGSMVAKIIKKKREKQFPYKQFSEKFLPYHNGFSEQQKAAFSQVSKKDLAIIPIQ